MMRLEVDQLTDCRQGGGERGRGMDVGGSTRKGIRAMEYICDITEVVAKGTIVC